MVHDSAGRRTRRTASTDPAQRHRTPAPCAPRPISGEVQYSVHLEQLPVRCGQNPLADLHPVRVAPVWPNPHGVGRRSTPTEPPCLALRIVFASGPDAPRTLTWHQPAHPDGAALGPDEGACRAVDDGHHQSVRIAFPGAGRHDPVRAGDKRPSSAKPPWAHARVRCCPVRRSRGGQ